MRGQPQRVKHTSTFTPPRGFPAEGLRTCCTPLSVLQDGSYALFDSSFQSAFHLSLKVLVHYRSCCNPNQPDSPKRPRVPQSVAPMHSAITLSGAPFLSDFGRTLQGRPFSRLQFANATHWRLEAWAVPASLAATGGNLARFIFLRLLICLNSAGRLI